MKYIELFKNGFDSPVIEKIKPENGPYVGYSPSEGLMLTEILKEEEIDPAAGFVDLGLSVMWASCNLGASSPEEPGLFYSWGEVEGHELAADGESFKDGHIFNEENYQYPNTDDATFTLKLSNDAVYQFMLQHSSYDMVKFRMPTFDQYNELIANTTSELSAVNNIPVYTLTSIVNGNSIQVPIVGGFSALYEDKNYHYNSYSYLWSTAKNAGKLNGTDGHNADVYDYVNHSFLPNQGLIYTGLPIRGVCDPLPLADFLFPGRNYNIVKDKVYAIRCEHGLEMSYTGTIQLSATPNFDTFVTIEVKDLIQLTPLDLTQCVSNILYTDYSQECYGNTKLLPELYCYIKFDNSANAGVNYWNTEYLKMPLLYNGLEVRVDTSSTNPSGFPMLRIKYSTIENKTIIVSNVSNASCNIAIFDSLTKYFNSSVLPFYKALSRKATVTIDSDTIASLSDYVDENGYLYLGYKCSSSRTTATLQFTIE